MSESEPNLATKDVYSVEFEPFLYYAARLWTGGRRPAGNMQFFVSKMLQSCVKKNGKNIDSASEASRLVQTVLKRS